MSEVLNYLWPVCMSCLGFLAVWFIHRSQQDIKELKQDIKEGFDSVHSRISTNNREIRDDMKDIRKELTADIKTIETTVQEIKTGYLSQHMKCCTEFAHQKEVDSLSQRVSNLEQKELQK